MPFLYSGRGDLRAGRSGDVCSGGRSRDGHALSTGPDAPIPLTYGDVFKQTEEGILPAGNFDVRQYGRATESLCRG